MSKNENFPLQGKTTYNVKEVATLLNICLPAAYDLCNREDFPAIRVTPRGSLFPPMVCSGGWRSRPPVGSRMGDRHGEI